MVLLCYETAFFYYSVKQILTYWFFCGPDETTRVTTNALYDDDAKRPHILTDCYGL